MVLGERPYTTGPSDSVVFQAWPSHLFFFFRISVPRATSIGVQVGKVILGQKIWPFFFLLFSKFDQLLTETPLLPYGGGDGDVINTRLLQLVTF